MKTDREHLYELALEYQDNARISASSSRKMVSDGCYHPEMVKLSQQQSADDSAKARTLYNLAGKAHKVDTLIDALTTYGEAARHWGAYTRESADAEIRDRLGKAVAPIKEAHYALGKVLDQWDEVANG